MNATYVASDNSAGDAQVLGASGEDIRVMKIIFGNPADGKVFNLYNKRVAPGHVSGMGSVSTDSLALQITQPTAAAGKDWVRDVDFGAIGGFPVDGGSFHTDGSDVTVIWKVADPRA